MPAGAGVDTRSNADRIAALQQQADAAKTNLYQNFGPQSEKYFAGKSDPKRIAGNPGLSQGIGTYENLMKQIAGLQKMGGAGAGTPGGAAPAGTPKTGGGFTMDPNQDPRGPMGGGQGGTGAGYREGIGGMPNFFSTDASRPAQPNMPGYNYQGGPGADYLAKVFQGATQGSTDAYNNAANRLRERTDAATLGNVNRAQNQNLSRGLGASGINDFATSRERGLGMNAYAQGLSDLELGMEDRRLQGLNTALGAAGQSLTDERGRNQMSLDDIMNRRGLSNSNWQFGQTLDQGNRNFMDQLRLNLLNSREQRGSNESISAAGNRTQENLGQLGETGSNWRASLGVGANKEPAIVNVPNLANTGNVLQNAGFNPLGGGGGYMFGNNNFGYGFNPKIGMGGYGSSG